MVAGLALALAALAAALAAVDQGGERSDRAQADPGPLHVHGLGVNPADRALFIASHTGLFRLGQGEREALRVAGRYQDTMGFTVVGPDRFLGSGHPDVREAREQPLPSRLGLVRSTDAGRSWNPVSLLGEADFHVLRIARRRIYGFDATDGALRVSRDGGRNWSRYSVPAPLIDLAADPTGSSRLVATTERGLYASADEGRTWSMVGDGVGFLAWPAPRRLYLASAGGQLFVSPDAGKRWRQVGDIGGKPAALLAANRQELYAALQNGTIMRSADGGGSWGLRSRPS